MTVVVMLASSQGPVPDEVHYDGQIGSELVAARAFESWGKGSGSGR